MYTKQIHLDISYMRNGKLKMILIPCSLVCRMYTHITSCSTKYYTLECYRAEAVFKMSVLPYRGSLSPWWAAFTKNQTCIYSLRHTKNEAGAVTHLGGLHLRAVEAVWRSHSTAICKSVLDTMVAPRKSYTPAAACKQQSMSLWLKHQNTFKMTQLVCLAHVASNHLVPTQGLTKSLMTLIDKTLTGQITGHANDQLMIFACFSDPNIAWGDTGSALQVLQIVKNFASPCQP